MQHAGRNDNLEITATDIELQCVSGLLVRRTCHNQVATIWLAVEDRARIGRQHLPHCLLHRLTRLLHHFLRRHPRITCRRVDGPNCSILHRHTRIRADVPPLWLPTAAAVVNLQLGHIRHDLHIRHGLHAGTGLTQEGTELREQARVLGQQRSELGLELGGHLRPPLQEQLRECLEARWFGHEELLARRPHELRHALNWRLHLWHLHPQLNGLSRAYIRRKAVDSKRAAFKSDVERR